MIDPAQLLQLAEELMSPPRRGRPRQVHLRRAVSSAYYAAFHHLCTQATDLLVGATERQNRRYRIVYRSFDHRKIRTSCVQSSDYSDEIKDCARHFVDLQAARLEADYNPAAYFSALDVQSMVHKAREVIASLGSANAEERKAFLTSFKFKLRS